MSSALGRRQVSQLRGQPGAHRAVATCDVTPKCPVAQLQSSTNECPQGSNSFVLNASFLMRGGANPSCPAVRCASRTRHSGSGAARGDTHQISHLVSGIVIAALGVALLALATVGYRRLPGAERRAIFGNAKQSERACFVAAAVWTVSSGIQVWLAFTPDVGPKGLPIAVLSFGLAAVYLVAARRKRRLSSPESHYQRDIRAIQMNTYVRTKPRPAPQLGAHGLEGRYGGGA